MDSSVYDVGVRGRRQVPRIIESFHKILLTRTIENANHFPMQKVVSNRCFKRWESLPYRVDSSEFDLCSKWRPCKGSSRPPAGRGMLMIMKVFMILVDSKRTKNSLVKNTSEFSEHKWMNTGTSPLGSLQQVWSSLHENDGSWGHLWLPLAKIMTHSFCIFISNLWLPLGKKEYRLRICGVL